MAWQSIIYLPISQQVLWVSVTLIVYLVAIWLFKFLSFNILFHPIMLGAILIGGGLALSNTPLIDYLLYTKPINWMLGPVTLALAIPLYQQVNQLYATGRKGLLVIIFGGCSAPLIAFACLNLFDFSDSITFSVLTKSITTPLAMDTAKFIGGLPELAAGVVVLTGIVGVMCSQIVFKLTCCSDHQARGIALGTISHAIGTASALQVNAKMGAFSTMALCINGIVTAVILPVVFMLVS